MHNIVSTCGSLWFKTNLFVFSEQDNGKSHLCSGKLKTSQGGMFYCSTVGPKKHTKEKQNQFYSLHVTGRLTTQREMLCLFWFCNLLITIWLKYLLVYSQLSQESDWNVKVCKAHTLSDPVWSFSSSSNGSARTHTHTHGYRGFFK